MENLKKEWAITSSGMFTGRDLDGFMREILTPTEILRSGNRTIVFWEDGDKTIVKRSENEEDDVYAAFTAALAKKLYGSGNAVKNIIRDRIVLQMKVNGKTVHVRNGKGEK